MLLIHGPMTWGEVMTLFFSCNCRYVQAWSKWKSVQLYGRSYICQLTRCSLDLSISQAFHNPTTSEHVNSLSHTRYFPFPTASIVEPLDVAQILLRKATGLTQLFMVQVSIWALRPFCVRSFSDRNRFLQRIKTCCIVWSFDDVTFSLLTLTRSLVIV